MRYRGLIFDLDGTLIDSYRAIASSLNAARAKEALPPLDHQTIRQAVGRGLESLIAEWVNPEDISRGVQHFREHYAQCFLEQTHCLPGVHRLIPKLSEAGFKLTVASNKPARFGRAILRHFELDECFEGIHGPDTVGYTKPHPAMLTQCLQDMQLTSEESLYIGDMPLDLESGNAVRVDTWLVATGSAEETAIQSLGVPWARDFESLVNQLECPAK